MTARRGAEHAARLADLRERANRRGRISRPSGDDSFATARWDDVTWLLDLVEAQAARTEELEQALREAQPYETERELAVRIQELERERDLLTAEKRRIHEAFLSDHARLEAAGVGGQVAQEAGDE